MKHGIYSQNSIYLFPEHVGDLSAGRAVTTTTRFSRNAAGKSQTLARRGRLTAQTYTIQYTITRTTAGSLELAMYKAEELNGAMGNLFWRDHDLGLVVVESVGISCLMDSAGVAECTIALNLREGVMRQAYKSVSIQTYKGV